MLSAVAIGDTGRSRALLFGALLSGLLYGVYRILSIGRRGRKLPPGNFALFKCEKYGLVTIIGPPTVPILGNEHQNPAADGHFL